MIEYMIRKLMRVGNSIGITLDKKMLRRIGLDGVTWIKVELDIKKKIILLKKRNDDDW